MPVILGPDGPSLGGFVCPLTVAAAERWKLGQLAAGRHGPLRPVDAPTPRATGARRPGVAAGAPAVLRRVPGGDDRPGVTYRRAGDRDLLVEYGDRWCSTSTCACGSTC